ncbi:MAG: hypothetical protein M1840_008650 [Geoglossum simile]|nr:MAG: hypothetical protein M1840_008650 [Geoglossum simile]
MTRLKMGSGRAEEMPTRVQTPPKVVTGGMRQCDRGSGTMQPGNATMRPRKCDGATEHRLVERSRTKTSSPVSQTSRDKLMKMFAAAGNSAIPAPQWSAPCASTEEADQKTKISIITICFLRNISEIKLRKPKCQRSRKGGNARIAKTRTEGKKGRENGKGKRGKRGKRREMFRGIGKAWRT